MPTAAYDYAAASRPKIFQVLGVELQPLCIDHCISMQRENVAFVSQKETTVTVDDLILGVLICSKLWSEGEFERYKVTEQCQKDVEAWGEKVGAEIGDYQDKVDLIEKCKIFHEYVLHHSREPAFWKLNDAGQTTGAHWTQCVLLTLTAHCGYTRQEALHAPLPLALADYFRYAETQGIVRLMTGAEMEMIEAAERAEKEAKEKEAQNA